MPSAALIIRSPGEDRQEVELSGDASVGRAFDNTICIRDTGASRYHAIIEKRPDGHWLKDLGSINGTSVNGIPITRDYKLEDGDSVSIGGQSTIVYRSYISPAEEDYSSPEPPCDPISTNGGAAPATVRPQGPSPVIILIAVAAALVVIGLAAVVLSFLFKPGKGVVRLASPLSGAVVRGPITVRVEAENTRSIGRVLYQIDGVEVGSAQVPPFDISLDPAQLSDRLPGLSVGTHVLSVTVEDKGGKRERQPDTALLSFNIAGGTPGDDSGTVTPPGGGPDVSSGSTPGAGNMNQSSADVAGLSEMLAANISPKKYVFDREFINQVSSHTAEYRISILSDAKHYSWQIKHAFSSRGVPVQLGFIMAIAQSKFSQDPSTGLAGSDAYIGFWRVPRTVAIDEGYIRRDETLSALNEPGRSADIASSYMKDLLDRFGADDFMFMYAVACWGMSMAQAGSVRQKLESVDPNMTGRRDFWKMVKSGVVPPEGADRVTKFFAAGIVAENPEAFVLTQEPLSSVY